MSAWASRLRASRATAVGAVGLGLWALLAVFADFIASDLPLLLKREGRVYVLPALTRPADLRGEDHRSLREKLDDARGDWMLSAPVPFGPYEVFTPRDSNRSPPSPPDAEHWLGTDEVGRDVLSRIIHGARVSLAVGLASMAIAALIGLVLGLLAGYFGSWLDLIVSRLIELAFVFPAVFFLLALAGTLRLKTILPVIAVIGLTRWTEVARFVRAEALRLRELDFVRASRVLGASHLYVLRRHVIPNVLEPLRVAAMFTLADAILIESALTFLGVGVPPPVASWGELLAQANSYAAYPGAWWLAVYPGLALFSTIAFVYLLGEDRREVREATHARKREPPQAAVEESDRAA